jgi:acetamidase/formamidase
MSHRLDANSDTVHWGYLDASIAPKLTINSGDEITLSTVSGGPDMLPPWPASIPSGLTDIHTKLGKPILPGHICTGPIAVRGAKAGHVLQIDILDISLHYDFGYTYVRPLSGALPDEASDFRRFPSRIDRVAKSALMPWGHEIPLNNPFFGVMVTAPPPEWGQINTLPPRRNGGNLDNKELIAGTTLYLPVFVDGANFSVGDGHGAQGDGEVCVTAIETGLIGSFRLTARNDMRLVWPLAETPTHMITMAFDASLDAAAQIALRSMIDLVTERTALDRDEAYALLSLVGDVRVTQLVNGNKGIHVMLAKEWFNKPIKRA